MKKMFLFLSIIVTSSLCGSQILEDPAFLKMVNEQNNKDKIVLMFYSAKTCPQCAYMKQKVFKETKVKKYLQDHFTILEKDINKDDLPSGFDYFGIPTMFFINDKGQQIAKIVGSSRGEPFLQSLERIVKKVH